MSTKTQQLYTVRAESFSTRSEAYSYARVASRMFDGFFVVMFDGFAVETFRQGKKVSA